MVGEGGRDGGKGEERKLKVRDALYTLCSPFVPLVRHLRIKAKGDEGHKRNT